MIQPIGPGPENNQHLASCTSQEGRADWLETLPASVLAAMLRSRGAFIGRLALCEPTLRCKAFRSSSCRLDHGNDRGMACCSARPPPNEDELATVEREHSRRMQLKGR